MAREIITVLGFISVGLWLTAFHNWRAQENEAHQQAVRTPRFLSAMAMIASAAMFGISGYITGNAAATGASPGLWLMTAGISTGFFIMAAVIFWRSTLYTRMTEVMFKRAMVAANSLMKGDEPQEVFNGATAAAPSRPGISYHPRHQTLQGAGGNPPYGVHHRKNKGCG